MMTLSVKLSRPSYTDFGPDEHLSPIFPRDTTPSFEAWEKRRNELRTSWEATLGRPSYGPFDHTEQVIDSFELPYAYATVFRQPNSPGTQQLVLLMEPKTVPQSPRPGAVVPYYHPDLMAGYDLAQKRLIEDDRNRQFGRHLVQQGYVVVCVEAFPYNTVPDPGSDEAFAWWYAAAEVVLRDNPQWTGMGKLVHDTRLATDLLLRQPNIDRDRIVIIGHSLGGKMAFYNGCLDERIKATIASDFGIGYSFTNWQDPWYLGERIRDPGLRLAHHHLLVLHAPRPFFLIAGHYDGPASWQYLNEARKVYELYGRAEALGCFDHGTGHQPTDESVTLAYQWLAEQFGLAEEPYEI